MQATKQTDIYIYIYEQFAKLHATQYTHEANADYRLYCKLHSIHMKHMQCTHEANVQVQMIL
jgi:hypothetical protein